MPFGLILLAILLLIAFFSVKWIMRYNKAEDIAVSPFKCPNCEQEFHISAAKALFTPCVTLAFNKKMKLKCPHCNKTDMCKWLSEIDL